MHLTTEIKSALKELGIRPNKRLGQNFLVTQSTYDKMVSALRLNSNQKVVEVGPGLGTLTKFLAKTGANVIAVEKDKNLVPYLLKKFDNTHNVKIVDCDILKFNPSEHGLKNDEYKLVGNIPYYLTSKLLRNVFESWPRPITVLFMMQLEVAQKLTEKPPKMTLLSVAMQYYSTPKIIAKISAGNFFPPPDITSALVQFTPHEYGMIDEEKTSAFFKIVTAGFGQKRKQLINNLPVGLGLSKEEIEKSLDAAGIDPKARPETLTLDKWKELTQQLYSQL